MTCTGIKKIKKIKEKERIVFLFFNLLSYPIFLVGVKIKKLIYLSYNFFI